MAAPKIEKLLTAYNFSNKDSVDRIKYIVIHYVGALGGAKKIANILQVSILEHPLIIS